MSMQTPPCPERSEACTAHESALSTSAWRCKRCLCGPGSSVVEHGFPAALLWSCLILAIGRPWWHRHGDCLKWLVRAVRAELECGPERNREADPGPQVHCPGFVTILMAPHPPGAADDVPDLLNGGVGNGFGDLAGLQLEVSKAAESAEVAQHPDR